MQKVKANLDGRKSGIWYTEVMRILFLGAPGTGKSTQGRILAEKMGWKWLSSGEMLRELEDLALAERLKNGELVDDREVASLVIPEIRKERDLILDGFPRTEVQVRIMAEAGVLPEWVVEIAVDTEELVRRMLARGRAEDNVETIRRRLEIYQKTRAEVVAALEESGVRVQKIDGQGDIETIAERIESALGEAI